MIWYHTFMSLPLERMWPRHCYYHLNGETNPHEHWHSKNALNINIYRCKIKSTAEAKFNHSKHSTCSYNSLKQLQLQRFKHKKHLSWEEACPATNYVAATFHPTIGQCAHQSLSTTATLELGMIPTRNKGTLAGSHIAKYIWKFSQAKLQLGLSGFQGGGKLEPLS